MSAPPPMSGANSDNKQPSGTTVPPPPPGGPTRVESDIYNAETKPAQSGSTATATAAATPADSAAAKPAKMGWADKLSAFGKKHTTAAPPASTATDPSGQQQKPAKMGWADQLTSMGMKAAGPINALAHKMGAEGFLPETMDKECEKAARILRAFCKEGVYTDTATLPAPATQPKPEAGTTAVGRDSTAKVKKDRTLLHIPSKVISRAVGLAIFTTARLGYMATGATGSGVLIARLPDGRWSPPSGIQVHTLGAGFVIGVDIYDCVVVINTREALEAFTRTRMSLGTDLAVVAGPWGAGGAIDVAAPEGEFLKKKEKGKGADAGAPGAAGAPTATPAATGDNLAPAAGQPAVILDQTAAGGKSGSNSRQPSPYRQSMKPVYSYVKSRGFYAGVQVDGTVVTERKDANAAFYGTQGVTVSQILKGEIPHATGAAWNIHVKQLHDVVRGAEGFGPGDQMDPPSTLMNQMNLGASTGAPSAQYPPTGAPPSKAQEAGYQVPPPPASTLDPPGSSAAPPAATVPAASAAPAMTTFPPPPPGPPPATTAAAPELNWKEREAAAEAAAAQSSASQGTAAPPGYSEFATAGSSELPPAYVDDGQPKPGVGDSKTGQH